MIARLRELLDPYDTYQVECDGFVLIAAHVLCEADVPHTVYSGSALVARGETPEYIPFHFWIEVEANGESITVDYRLRMWTGDYAPHGVFVNRGEVEYERAGELEIRPSEFLFKALTRGVN